MGKEHIFEGLEDIRESIRNAAKIYEQSTNDFWEALPYDDKLKAFYAVCKRIHKADLEDKGTYRYALYDVFNFNSDAYTVGMECGYLEIHNALFEAKNPKEEKDE
jgi:hypothetical protein